MDRYEGFRSEPVSTGAGQLLLVEGDGEARGVEMATPASGEVERQNEVDRLGIGIRGLVDVALHGDDPRVGAQRDPLVQAVRTRRLEQPMQGDAARRACDAAFAKTRCSLAYRAPRLP